MVEVDALRTPEERFRDLPGFPYGACYVDDLRGYEGLRGAYVDEGPTDAQHVFLCLHGQPTWSYLYRKMIPVFLRAGGRVVAPDFLGFGRSDKPVNAGDYGFHFHRNFLLRLVERLDLQRITLVCQDWGGLIGLTLPADAAFAGRLSRLIVMNTGIAVGNRPSLAFLGWRTYNNLNRNLDVSGLMKLTTPVLTKAEAAAYDAPFPDARYKAGVRTFPNLVMTRPDMAGVAESRQAIGFWSERWSGPSFMAVGPRDPVFGVGPMQKLAAQIRGCLPPLVVPGAGHFLQEWGEGVAEAALARFGDR